MEQEEFIGFDPATDEPQYQRFERVLNAENGGETVCISDLINKVMYRYSCCFNLDVAFESIPKAQRYRYEIMCTEEFRHKYSFQKARLEAKIRHGILSIFDDTDEQSSIRLRAGLSVLQLMEDRTAQGALDLSNLVGKITKKVKDL